jgi:hypothetical protein
MDRADAYAAVGEAEHRLAVEPAGVGVVDVLEGGGDAHLRRVEASLLTLVLAGLPLGVDEQSEAFVEAELGMLGRGLLQPKGFGHARELHRVQLLDRGFHQHSCSLVAA